MTDNDFQCVVLRRFDRLDKRMSCIEQEQASTRGALMERCRTRGKNLAEHTERIQTLEEAEHRRRGGLAMAAALGTSAGALGAILAKLLPLGKYHG